MNLNNYEEFFFTQLYELKRFVFLYPKNKTYFFKSNFYYSTSQTFFDKYNIKVSINYYKPKIIDNFILKEKDYNPSQFNPNNYIAVFYSFNSTKVNYYGGNRKSNPKIFLNFLKKIGEVSPDHLIWLITPKQIYKLFLVKNNYSFDVYIYETTKNI